MAEHLLGMHMTPVPLKIPHQKTRARRGGGSQDTSHPTSSSLTQKQRIPLWTVFQSHRVPLPACCLSPPHPILATVGSTSHSQARLSVLVWWMVSTCLPDLWPMFWELTPGSSSTSPFMAEILLSTQDLRCNKGSKRLC